MSDYTNYGFNVAVPALKRYPANMRWILHWFLPEARKMRELLKRTTDVISPYIERREALKATGAKVPNDGFEWVNEVSNPENWDSVTFFLALGANSIHTTTDLMLETVERLAERSELIQPIREEIVAAFQKHGLEKGSLGDMKLLDSVMKESQRLKPLLLSMIHSTLSYY